jgi:hypothetical protein
MTLFRSAQAGFVEWQLGPVKIAVIVRPDGTLIADDGVRANRHTTFAVDEGTTLDNHAVPESQILWAGYPHPTGESTVRSDLANPTRPILMVFSPLSCCPDQ